MYHVSLKSKKSFKLEEALRLVTSPADMVTNLQLSG